MRGIFLHCLLGVVFSYKLGKAHLLLRLLSLLANEGLDMLISNLTAFRFSALEIYNSTTLEEKRVPLTEHRLGGLREAEGSSRLQRDLYHLICHTSAKAEVLFCDMQAKSFISI